MSGPKIGVPLMDGVASLMMDALRHAAEHAAERCEHNLTVSVSLRPGGFVVMGRVELALVGYNYELAVPYVTMEVEPTALLVGVEKVADLLQERRRSLGMLTVTVSPAGQKPEVNLTEHSHWSYFDKAVRAFAVLAIVVCIPLAGGLF
ncbi:MAG: hypothetical protein NTX28_10080 [Novosphingobium sp.]|nr:hypothetical protein [Novosphingobium sp.]